MVACARALWLPRSRRRSMRRNPDRIASWESPGSAIAPARAPADTRENATGPGTASETIGALYTVTRSHRSWTVTRSESAICCLFRAQGREEGSAFRRVAGNSEHRRLGSYDQGPSWGSGTCPLPGTIRSARQNWSSRQSVLPIERPMMAQTGRPASSPAQSGPARSFNVQHLEVCYEGREVRCIRWPRRPGGP